MDRGTHTLQFKIPVAILNQPSDTCKTHQTLDKKAYYCNQSNLQVKEF